MSDRAAPPCFLCGEDDPREPERPWEWNQPRMLCRRHDGVSRLPDGPLLRDVLERIAPPDGPLEGSLLGWIFNPVIWRGSDGREVRAWTDFVAGGVGLLEDRFGAADYFEFYALTSPSALDLLYALRLVLDDASAPRPVPGGLRENLALLHAIHRHVSRIKGPELVQRVDAGYRRLFDLWNSEARLRARRAAVARQWPDSYDELREWLAMWGLAEADAHAIAGRTFFKALAALAERRFP